MSAKPVRVVCGAYNGRSPAIEAQIRRVHRYVGRTAAHWAGTQAEYNEWAQRVVADALRNLAARLCVEESPTTPQRWSGP